MTTKGINVRNDEPEFWGFIYANNKMKVFFSQ